MDVERSPHSSITSIVAHTCKVTVFLQQSLKLFSPHYAFKICIIFLHSGDCSDPVIICVFFQLKTNCIWSITSLLNEWETRKSVLIVTVLLPCYYYIYTFLLNQEMLWLYMNSRITTEAKLFNIYKKLFEYYYAIHNNV